MKSVLECEGSTCVYHRIYYDVIQTGHGSFVPNFGATDERCAHPTQLGKMASERVIDRIGIRLVTMNKCPK
jgi:hypothetical protein